MTIKCPKCQSERIDSRNYGKKAGSAIGTVAGAISVAAGMMRGAEVGATAGMIFGPVGIPIGTIAGAILGGLIGGTAGGAVGSRLGEFIDKNIFDNYQCLACGHKFGQQHPTSPADDRTGDQHSFHVHQEGQPPGFGSNRSHDHESEFR
jgi:DNA-directed RNA polymerase subunit RPC12/RpoP